MLNTTLKLVIDGVMLWRNVKLASNPKSTSTLLKALLNLEDATVCHSLGANPNTPEDIVFNILNHQYFYSSSVAKNPKISTRCVEYLLNKKYGLTDLATNQYLTADTYAELATLEDVELLENLAKNHSTPPTVLATLAESKKIDVRIQVGLNPNTNASTLRRYSIPSSLRAFDISSWGQDS